MGLGRHAGAHALCSVRRRTRQGRARTEPNGSDPRATVAIISGFSAGTSQSAKVTQEAALRVTHRQKTLTRRSAVASAVCHEHITAVRSCRVHQEMAGKRNIVHGLAGGAQSR
jgi:hypothetical protein